LKLLPLRNFGGVFVIIIYPKEIEGLTLQLQGGKSGPQKAQNSKIQSPERSGGNATETRNMKRASFWWKSQDETLISSF